jgi:hypothetical protein
VATVWATCWTKTGSVRLGPSVGASNWPVTTWKLPISVVVPCRLCGPESAFGCYFQGRPKSSCQGVGQPTVAIR